MLSSHLFFCLPLLLAPFTVPCRTVFAMPEDLEMWPYYLSSVCYLGPHTKENADKIEMAQRRAARWTTNDYTRMTSVTSFLQLDWQTLKERRSVARLPNYIEPTHRISRYCHSMTFRQIHTGKDSYKYSFFPLTIVQWNALPGMQLLQVLTHSRQQLVNCTIPSPRCI